ncbi:MAG TPA: DUF5916 domain-containing protein [Gammaproteobacteria bacterium]|nr:DUF5916 domain-containing protein [Gammaproteobacteria bacterium]
MRPWLVAAALCVVAAATSAEPLDVPLLDAEPELADFTSMTPAETVRARFAVVSGFTQRSPDNGVQSRQRTDVYLGYDARNLYAVFVAFDDEPENVRANLAPRENIDYDDRVGLLVDTFNDQRTGYAFRSSPRGVQWDARWSEVTKGASFDTSFEALWYTDAAVTSGGYVVKMTIPFRTMRFPEGAQQRWNIQFERWIPRLSEESFWPPYSQTIDGRLNQASPLVGVRDVSPGRNMQVIPFAFVRSYDVLDPALAGGPNFSEDTESDVGLDAKFVLRDSFVLDLTLNPDFSQVESDQPQVTVNQRFEVQFPERRPFFLENNDYFTTETPLVFTRRIIDPEAGLKFTGRQGPWGVGTMLVNDEAQGSALPPAHPLHGETADIGVLRVFRDVGEQSRAGLLYTEREFGDTYNRVGAIDSRVKLTDNWSSELLLVNTETRTAAGDTFDGRQTNWRFDRNGRHALVHTHYTNQSEGFATQLGILGRNYQPDTRGVHGNVEYRFWPEGSWLDRFGPRVFYAHLDDQSGERIYSEISPAMLLAWAGDSNLSFGTNSIRERLRPPDFPGLTRTRDYSQERWYGELWSETFAKIGFYGYYDVGTVINLVPPFGAEPELADRKYWQAELRWRPMDRLRVDTNYLFTRLDDRNGAGMIFENRILRSRWNYQFTKEMSLRFIAQLEETEPNAPLTRLTHDRNLNFDVLFRYVLNPWSALYVGYNQNRSNFQLVELDEPNGSGQMTELVRTEDFARDGSQVFVKFSYLLQP